MTTPIRLLVVDDSAFARKVLRTVLSRIPNVEVVGVAGDGLEALEKIAELKPDVMTLDLVMPNLDGLGVLRALAALHSDVRVIVVSISTDDSEQAIEALELGAVDLVTKPTALATDRLFEIAGDLEQKILAAAQARPTMLSVARPAAPISVVRRATQVELVVVGTSTGGPQALTRLLSALPADFPVPIAIALHIPADYTGALARRLDQVSAIAVEEAHEGIKLRAGLAVLARGGIHLRVVRRGTALIGQITASPAAGYYFPSVNVLFESAASATGKHTLGVVMTGMGDDGLLGSGAIVRAGGRVITEAESSCVVYGMPRCVHEAGLSTREVPLDGVAAALIDLL